MVRRLSRFLVPSALLLVLALLVRRTVQLRDEVGRVVPSPDPWRPLAETPPPTVWVAPVEGVCPPSHPIKAKAASHIYHLPGMLYYDRTKPDRCYSDESAAVADGFTRSKR
jgi:hypothetical protein